MALTVDQMDQLTAWTGTLDPSGHARAERRLAILGDLDVVALEFMERQMSDLITQPAQLNIVGDVSDNWGPNMTLLRDRIKTLRGTLRQRLPDLNEAAAALVGASDSEALVFTDYVVPNARP